ncbi:MAG: IS5 family transposase [Planctomycetia bacterium]|nr:IS5 family transposase [Planctomycetia bacterium]
MRRWSTGLPAEFVPKVFGDWAERQVPDARTIWAFRERLKQEGIHDFLFRQFNKHLEKSRFRANGGQIVDATFQEVPVQHNTPEEKQKIQETGEAPEEWTARKKAHKDVDARWTKKRNCLHYGYKNHINIDRRHKFIREYCVTSAQVHDSQCFTEMLNNRATSRKVWADSAYMSAANILEVEKKKLVPLINEKGHRGHTLTDAKKQENRQKSRIRCRVEHVFGLMNKVALGSRKIYTVGLVRAKVKVCFKNLAYNILRLTILMRPTGKLRTY